MVRPNPRAEEYACYSRTWLCQRGVIRTQEDDEKFHKLSVGEYANWPFPAAPEERAKIITIFLALWIFYDDFIEEADDGQLGVIGDAIRGFDPLRGRADSTFVACWRELGKSCASVMSPSWVERHATRFVSWVESVREESAKATDFRVSGVLPSLAEHMLRRRMNIGMMPNIDFIDYQLGWELPEEVLADPEMAIVADVAADCVAICNDLFGFEKDRSLIWANCVSCAMQEFGIDTFNALRMVAALHNKRVEQLIRHELVLVERHSRCPMLVAWFNSLHHIIYGFTQWHSRAPRYCSVYYADEQMIQLTVASFGVRTHNN